MKTTLLNLRMEQDCIDELDNLAGKALNRQAVARMLLIAALDAVRKNQGNLKFPPEFQVASALPFEPTVFRIKEPANPAKRK